MREGFMHIDSNAFCNLALQSIALGWQPAFTSYLLLGALLIWTAAGLSSSSTRTPLALSPVAFGTLNPAYDESVQGTADILNSLPKGTLIDTAERYGTNDGDAEIMLGSALRQLRSSSSTITTAQDDEILIASKFAPKPWRLTSDSVVEACRASIQRLGVDSIYLYQLHYSDAVSQPLKLFGYVDNKGKAML